MMEVLDNTMWQHNTVSLNLKVYNIQLLESLNQSSMKWGVELHKQHFLDLLLSAHKKVTGFEF